MAAAVGNLTPAAILGSMAAACLLPRLNTVSFKTPPSLTRCLPSLRPIRPPGPKFQVRAARTDSGNASLGFRAPYFELPEPLTGKVWILDDFEPYPALLVMFICNHCPFVKHLKKDIVKLTNFYIGKGLAAAAISSNSTITHPQDGPQFMAEEAKLFNYPFPYLFDEVRKLSSIESLHTYLMPLVLGTDTSICNPDFDYTPSQEPLIQDGRRPFELFYHGQFDDSRPSNNVPITGRDLSLAIDCALSGQRLSSVQKPSVGCSIKWHPGKGQ